MVFLQTDTRRLCSRLMRRRTCANNTIQSQPSTVNSRTLWIAFPFDRRRRVTIERRTSHVRRLRSMVSLPMNDKTDSRWRMLVDGEVEAHLRTPNPAPRYKWSRRLRCLWFDSRRPLPLPAYNRCCFDTRRPKHCRAVPNSPVAEKPNRSPATSSPIWKIN